MHILCMPTKTISLELDAYEKLKRAKKSSGESFSSVVRRGKFENRGMTGREALAHWEALYKKNPDAFLSEEELDRMNEEQENPHISPSPWDE